MTIAPFLNRKLNIISITAVLVSIYSVAFSSDSLQSKETTARNDTANSSGNVKTEKTNRRSVKTVLPSGVLFGTFTKEDGPYLIDGNVIVPAGQILEFGAACTVYVGGDYTTITVFGQMFARGTEEAPVVFMSAKTVPQPWDWDRIYCRSRNRSLFEHCIIRHSNFGIYVENGSAGINNCRFERNSLHGLVVKNAEVSIFASVLTGGHVCAINLLPGAQLTADSLMVQRNNTAVSCAPQSMLKLNGGYLSFNSNGLIAAKGSSVEIVGTEVSRNKIGVIFTREIPRKIREMVYANKLDVKVVPQDEMKKLLKEPQPVASIVVPRSSDTVEVASGFSPGFSAMSVPQEASTSFIGNVTTGFTFFRPRSEFHPYDRDTTETYSTGEGGTEDTLRTIESVLRPQNRYPGEQSDDWYSGIQPELQFFANGRRGNADINLLMDLYSNQWLSTTNYIGKNMFNLSMNYAQQSVVIGDFFESGSETSIPGRQMTGIKYSGKYLEMGRGEKRLEFKLAAGETEIAKDSGDHEIFVYNQSVDTGMSQRQQITYLAEATFKPTRQSSIAARGIIAHDQTGKPLFRKALSDPAALDPVVAQTGCITGSLFLFERKLELFGEIDLGSADTLDDSTGDEIVWYNPNVEKAIPEVFSLFKPDDFQEHAAGIAGARGDAGGYTGEVKYMQIAPSYYSAGDPYLINWRKNLNASVGKIVNDKWGINGSYEFDRSILKGFSEDDDPSITDLNIVSLNTTYEMGENKPSFSVDYTLQHQRNDARESVVREDTSYSEDFKEKEFSSRVSVEGKQKLKNDLSYSLRYQMLFDNDYSVHPDELLNNEGDRMHNAVSGWLSFKIKRIVRNKTSFRLGFKHENRDSLRAWQYKLSDQLTVHIIPRKLSCSIAGIYLSKSEKEYATGEWGPELFTRFYSGELEVKYSLTSRLTCSAMGKYEKSYDEITGSSDNYSVIVGGFHLTYLF
ncbi:MAG: hypothetical protein JW863_01835 [Chitinispirillaceae bacterium]|nr:hypothetical protein [Chitinispirillaceae bacterium]